MNTPQYAVIVPLIVVAATIVAIAEFVRRTG